MEDFVLDQLIINTGILMMAGVIVGAMITVGIMMMAGKISLLSKNEKKNLPERIKRKYNILQASIIILTGIVGAFYLYFIVIDSFNVILLARDLQYNFMDTVFAVYMILVVILHVIYTLALDKKYGKKAKKTKK